jgi:hypothetical protein
VFFTVAGFVVVAVALPEVFSTLRLDIGGIGGGGGGARSGGGGGGGPVGGGIDEGEGVVLGGMGGTVDDEVALGFVVWTCCDGGVCGSGGGRTGGFGGIFAGVDVL